jgi:hypothetical protein
MRLANSYEVSGAVTLRRGRFAAATWATVISSLCATGAVFTGESIFFWVAGLLWLPTYIRVREENARMLKNEPPAKLELSPTGIRFIWPGNESELKFQNVKRIAVQGTMTEPQSLLFTMKSGERHEIKGYDGIREMHLHAQSKLPLSIFEYENRI